MALVVVWATGMTVAAQVAEEDCISYASEVNAVNHRVNAGLIGWTCARNAPGDSEPSKTTWFWEYALRIVD
ncbi:MAG: hypothetical protein ACRDMY_05965 [Gaiellaceae bacterium]